MNRKNKNKLNNENEDYYDLVNVVSSLDENKKIKLTKKKGDSSRNKTNVVLIIFVILSVITVIIYLWTPIDAWVKLILIIGSFLGIIIFGYLIYMFDKTNNYWAGLITAILVYITLLSMLLLTFFQK